MCRAASKLFAPMRIAAESQRIGSSPAIFASIRLLCGSPNRTRCFSRMSASVTSVSATAGTSPRSHFGNSLWNAASLSPAAAATAGVGGFAAWRDGDECRQERVVDRALQAGPLDGSGTPPVRGRRRGGPTPLDALQQQGRTRPRCDLLPVHLDAGCGGETVEPQPRNIVRRDRNTVVFSQHAYFRARIVLLETVDLRRKAAGIPRGVGHAAEALRRFPPAGECIADEPLRAQLAFGVEAVSRCGADQENGVERLSGPIEALP